MYFLNIIPRTLGFESDEEGILNIAVSFDRTWMKRGHMSKIGCAFVTETHTGIVVDYVVLSSYCHACSVLAANHKWKKITQRIQY